MDKKAYALACQAEEEAKVMYYQALQDAVKSKSEAVHGVATTQNKTGIQYTLSNSSVITSLDFLLDSAKTLDKEALPSVAECIRKGAPAHIADADIAQWARVVRNFNVFNLPTLLKMQSVQEHPVVIIAKQEGKYKTNHLDAGRTLSDKLGNVHYMLEEAINSITNKSLTESNKEIYLKNAEQDALISKLQREMKELKAQMEQVNNHITEVTSSDFFVSEQNAISLMAQGVKGKALEEATGLTKQKLSRIRKAAKEAGKL